jgi:hypothetical protein
LRIDDQSLRLRLEGHEDVHVKSGDGFQIKSGGDRASNSVALNDAVCLHLVDNGDDFFDTHTLAGTNAGGR